MRPELVGAAALALCLASFPARAADRAQLKLGERLYREGASPSGVPLQAVVAADVPVTGRQVSCLTCHGNSGLGSVEGSRVVPPISAPFLAASRTLRSRPRPPYDDASLVRAVTLGIDSAGNPLDPLMPRYRLGKADALALVAYLRDLSARPSPGIEGDQLHLATVVAPGARPAAREAMQRVLEAYFRIKSANAADHRKRLVASWPEYYGQWNLHVWELRGPPSSWPRQLAAFYRARPVFAVVSGIGGDTWLPVHRFCEEQHLPCLLPNVETPPAPGAYSLYFSGGTSLEAAAIAARLAREPLPQRVIQIFAAGGEGERAASALAEALHRGGRDEVSALAPSSTPAVLEERIRAEKATAIVAWAGPRELGALATRTGLPTYVSASLLGGDVAARPPGSFLVQPFAPGSEAAPRFRRVASWLTRQGIAVGPGEERIADQTFFALTVFSEGLMHLKKNFLRDYLFEGIDHFSGFEHFSSAYPHLSFGPGQRILSKGCYLVSAEGGGRAEWILP